MYRNKRYPRYERDSHVADVTTFSENCMKPRSHRRKPEAPTITAVAPSGEKTAPGIRQVTLDSFRDFETLITDEFNDTRRYIWRGQRCSDWKLEIGSVQKSGEK